MSPFIIKLCWIVLCHAISSQVNELNKHALHVCRYDYLRISSDNHTVGTYCGRESGRNIRVNGRYAVLTFHSDGSDTYSGYKLFFSFFPRGKYKESDGDLSKLYL